MANRQQRRATKTMQDAPQMSPEQIAQMRAEEEMQKFIEENGIEAMIQMQIQWKTNDVNAKFAAASNIKAWFETVYEIADLKSKGLADQMLKGRSIEDRAEQFTNFKVDMYQSIAEIYSNIDPTIFGKEDFENPFAKLWEHFENQRKSIPEALEELYAWTLLEDPVLWASSMNSMVLAHKASQFVEEEAE